MAQGRIVTFTTDFGLNDHYVGAMKGVVLSINPRVQVVDICNSVQSYDILDGAIAIAEAYSYFPAGTVHVVVVDPGVGTARRPLLVDTGKYIFIAPDNGVLSLVYQREGHVTVRHITADHYFLRPVSSTFHGRDIFAAVAGYVTKDVDLAKLGDEVTDYVRFVAPRPNIISDSCLKGVVLKVDKFGNLITNFTALDVPHLFRPDPPPFKIIVSKREITEMKSAYAGGTPAQIFGIVGSMGFLEIAANRDSAARIVGAEKGTEVSLVWENVPSENDKL